MSGVSRVRSAGLRVALAFVTVAGLTVALTTPALAAESAGAQHNSALSAAAAAAAKSKDVVPLCASAPAGKARCFALRRVDPSATKGIHPNVVEPGYGPADLDSAYNLPAGGGAGQTVAIVDAFDDPNAEADLAAYRTQFGLPACTTANGCFAKVDQRGGTTYPSPDSGWAGEISLDLDMVSAVAPAAHILLVEADDNSNDNLGASVDEAVALGAKYVSNSYGSDYDSAPGSGEDPSEVTDLDPHYNHPGVAIVASTGDDDYGVAYPAASQYVTAVGGTSLVPDGSARGWSESVWNNSFGGPGSGCSLYEAKPAWQTDSGCANRMEADVSAVADPETGVTVYDTYLNGGWSVFGGTSASSPIIAGVYADAGTPVAGTYPSSYAYGDTSALNDVTSGNNGSCSPAYYCTAQAGYDGPTGLGTPNGLDAFTTGPHGVISGTVTDASSHAPIAGAAVTTDGGNAITDSSGHYALTLPAGPHDVSVSDYGFAVSTAHSVPVVDGTTTAQDFALTRLPSVTISGKVTDASGHGWPLYATISVDGVPGGPIYTNPYTGKYTLTVPNNASYTMHIAANYPGYQAQSQSLSLGTANVVRNVGMSVDPMACDAPGYAVQTTGATQTFDGATTPAGWTVTNNTAAGGWVFNDPQPRGNLTGGTGGFAIVDSDFLGSGNTEDSYLTSPVSDLSAATTPDVIFNSDYRDLDSVAEVDLSISGGATWTNIWQSDGTDARGPSQVTVPIPIAAGKSQVQVRFHYTGTWAWWWQVDNVFVGNRTCAQLSGGLVAGRVTHVNPSGALVGATVTSVSAPADHASTLATPDDSSLGDGFYWLFSSLIGPHSFAATNPGYAPVSKSVNVKENATTQASFALTGAKLRYAPASIARTVPVNGKAKATISIHNTGGASATVMLGISPSVGWLGLGTTMVTVAKNATVTVPVTLNANSPDVTGPGPYTAAVTLTTNTGQLLPNLPVTMTVTP